jgi:hypothetical protein
MAGGWGGRGRRAELISARADCGGGCCLARAEAVCVWLGLRGRGFCTGWRAGWRAGVGLTGAQVIPHPSSRPPPLAWLSAVAPPRAPYTAGGFRSMAAVLGIWLPAFLVAHAVAALFLVQLWALQNPRLLRALRLRPEGGGRGGRRRMLGRQARPRGGSRTVGRPMRNPAQAGPQRRPRLHRSSSARRPPREGSPSGMGPAPSLGGRAAAARKSPGRSPSRLSCAASRAWCGGGGCP